MRKIFKLFKNRYFLLSFSLSLIIIFFTYFMLYVDFVSRKTLLSDTSPVISFIDVNESKFMKIYAFGNKRYFDISFVYRILKAIFDFICIPI